MDVKKDMGDNRSIRSYDDMVAKAREIVGNLREPGDKNNGDYAEYVVAFYHICYNQSENGGKSENGGSDYGRFIENQVGTENNPLILKSTLVLALNELLERFDIIKNSKFFETLCGFDHTINKQPFKVGINNALELYKPKAAFDSNYINALLDNAKFLRDAAFILFFSFETIKDAQGEEKDAVEYYYGCLINLIDYIDSLMIELKEAEPKEKPKESGKTLVLKKK